MNSKLKDTVGKTIQLGQQTFQFLKEKYAAYQHQSDLKAMRTYHQIYQALPPQGQAHFPTPPDLKTIESWSAEQLHQERGTYPLTSISDKRLSTEFGFRNAILEKSFPCVVEIEGKEKAVVGSCKRRSGDMTDKERNHFLLVELLHLYGLLSAQERVLHGFVVIANSNSYTVDTRYTEKRAKQRAIGLVPHYQEYSIDTQDRASVYLTIEHLEENTSIVASAETCLRTLKNTARRNQTAQRLLTEFSRPGMLSGT